MAFGDKIDVLQVSRECDGLRLRVDGIPAGMVGSMWERAAKEKGDTPTSEEEARCLARLLRRAARDLIKAVGHVEGGALKIRVRS